MATLLGNKIKDTYTSLLKLDSNGATTTIKAVEDGAGTDTALSLSTDTVQVDKLKFTAAPDTAAAELTALFIDGNNEVVKRELTTTAFATNVAPLQEVVVGVTEADIVLSDTFKTAVYNLADNNTENTSYHFGNSPEELLFTPANGTIENRGESAFPVRVSITSTINVGSPNSEIIYKMQRNTGGGAFADIKTVTRYKSVVGVQADSFWGMFILEPTQSIRIQISTNGTATLLAGTELEVRKENVGNIL
jgi:hypothetical protein